MASVRESLIEDLVNEYDCEEDQTAVAVDRAIESGNPIMDSTDTDKVLEHIYSTQKYWE